MLSLLIVTGVPVSAYAAQPSGGIELQSLYATKPMSKDFYELHRGEQQVPPEIDMSCADTYGISANTASLSSPPSVATE